MAGRETVIFDGAHEKRKEKEPWQEDFRASCRLAGETPGRGGPSCSKLMRLWAEYELWQQRLASKSAPFLQQLEWIHLFNH